MVFENDPFEDFKRQRQIEILERKFKNKAKFRNQELNNLVKGSKPDDNLANRVHQEMQEFFAESQQHVSNLINQCDPEDSDTVEDKVNGEMADFFQTSTESIQDLITNLNDSEEEGSEVTERMVDHLDQLFQESINRIAQLHEKYGAPPDESDTEEEAQAKDLSDRIHTCNEVGESSDRYQQLRDTAQETSEDPVAASPTQHQPEAREENRAETGNLMGMRAEGDKDDTGGQRILKRQGHIPTTGSRKRGIRHNELNELRALKELLLLKGIITREELEAYMSDSM